MPAQDGTGPLGQGPLTGRGLGLCNTNAGIPLARRGFGRGRGLGRGMGLGRFAGCPFVQNQVVLTAEEEQKILEAEQAEIQKRLKELKSNK